MDKVAEERPREAAAEAAERGFVEWLVDQFRADASEAAREEAA